MGKQIKISLFDKSATKEEVLNSNGIVVLDNICVKAESYESLYEGDYTLDCIFIIDDKGLYKNIEEECILKVLINGREEIFRIVSIKPSTRDLTVFARQETISSTLAMHLADVRPTSLNGMATLDYMKRNSNEYIKGKQFARDLEVYSDITKSNTAYYNERSMYESLHDCDMSFYNRWGGEALRRGYKLSILNRVGQDRGFQVRSRKNLTGFIGDSNMSTVICNIKPKGFDGITIDGYVTSPLINNYVESRTTVITYDDVKVIDENNHEGYKTLAEAQKELTRRAKLEFEQNHIDEIQASYRVQFAELAKTEEYREYAILEQCEIGDTVNVYEENNNINITVRVISIKYNILNQSTIETELSNYDLTSKAISITNIIKELESIPDADDILNQAKKSATEMINAGLKNSYVLVRKDEILVMDTKDINTCKKCWRFNVNGLGYSSTGYNGSFGLAMTMDGQIVADFITTGILNANLIRAGVIKSFNDNLIINLDTGEVRFKKGLIEGSNSSWNLDTGIFKTEQVTSKQTWDVNIGKGIIYGNNYLQVESYKGLGCNYVKKTGEEVRYSGFNAYDWGNSITAYNDQIQRFMGGDIYIDSSQGKNVYINGRPVNSTLAYMENKMLESEGII